MANLLENLRVARQRLVDAKDQLRLAEDALHDVEALRTRHYLPQCDGKNAEQRKAQLDALLAEDEEYCQARAAVRQEQYAVDQTQADLDSLLDTRRLMEWQIRDRQAAALERLHRPAGDTEAQEVADDGIPWCDTCHEWHSPAAAHVARWCEMCDKQSVFAGPFCCTPF